MIRSVLLASIVAFFFQNAPAQSPRFVELMVEDTIWLLPDEIIYRVLIVEEPSESTRPALRQPGPAHVLQKVRKLVNDRQLDTLPSESYLISNTAFEQNPASLLIRFRSADELKTFIPQIASLKNLSASVVSVKSAEEFTAAQTLLARLVTKARLQAEGLARAVGKDSVHLLSVQEQTPDTGWTAYPPLSSIPGWHTTLARPDAFVVVYRKLVVRFAWE